MRNEEAYAAEPRRLFNKLCSGNRLTLTLIPYFSLTCEALAVLKVHGLHAHGEVQLPDIPCEKEDRATRQGERKKGRRKKMRKCGTKNVLRDRKNLLNNVKNLFSSLIS